MNQMLLDIAADKTRNQINDSHATFAYIRFRKDIQHRRQRTFVRW